MMGAWGGRAIRNLRLGGTGFDGGGVGMWGLDSAALLLLADIQRFGGVWDGYAGRCYLQNEHSRVRKPREGMCI